LRKKGPLKSDPKWHLARAEDERLALCGIGHFPMTIPLQMWEPVSREQPETHCQLCQRALGRGAPAPLLKFPASNCDRLVGEDGSVYLNPTIK
jgi:hypothetical protein